MKLHRTTPLLPCALTTLPQIARYLLPLVIFLARYTYTTLPQRHKASQPRGAGCTEAALLPLPPSGLPAGCTASAVGCAPLADAAAAIRVTLH